MPFMQTMNKKIIKAAFRRQKKELKLDYKTQKTKKKYAYRVQKQDLLLKKRAASGQEKKEVRLAQKKAKAEYKKERFLQKSIYLEKKSFIKKKRRAKLDSVVSRVTERIPESLSGSLTLSYVLIFFAFALIQSIFVVAATNYTIDKRIDDSLYTVANTLKASDLQEQVAKTLAEENRLNIALFSADGSLIYSHGLEELTSHLPYNTQYDEPFRFRHQAEEMRVYTVSEKGYSLNIARSINNENAFISIVVNLLMVSVALLLGISYFVGYRTARSILRPIGVLSHAMDEVSSADLSARLSTDNIRTELVEVVTSYNRMLDKIEEAYSRQKQFVSDASHELRTPLAIISGYSDILSRWGGENPEVRQEATDAIITQTANMQTLLERLLYIARSDNGAVQTELSSLPLAPLCKEILQDFQMLHPQKRFDLFGGATALCDPHLMRQLITVLLDNSAKFTPPDGQITLRLSEQESFCTLTVEDNGQGMSEEVCAHIFERFYKGDSSHNQKGHGLGLPIAKLIAETQGGTISVTSAPQKGSTFTVRLPK